MKTVIDDAAACSGTAQCDSRKLTPLQLSYIRTVMRGDDFNRYSHYDYKKRRHWKSWNDLIKRGLIQVSDDGFWNIPYVTPCAFEYFVPRKVVKNEVTAFDWLEVPCKIQAEPRWWDQARKHGWQPPGKKQRKRANRAF